MNHMPSRNAHGLTAEELECLSQLANGQDVPAIAAAMGRDAEDIEGLLDSARGKLGAASRFSAVLIATRQGLLA